MATTLMKSEQENQETDNDDDTVHYVWDDDPDESMCGKDVSGTAWQSNDVEVNCEACLDAAEFVREIEERLGAE